MMAQQAVRGRPLNAMVGPDVDSGGVCGAGRVLDKININHICSDPPQKTHTHTHTIDNVGESSSSSLSRVARVDQNINNDAGD